MTEKIRCSLKKTEHEFDVFESNKLFICSKKILPVFSCRKILRKTLRHYSNFYHENGTSLLEDGIDFFKTYSERAKFAVRARKGTFSSSKFGEETIQNYKG